MTLDVNEAGRSDGTKREVVASRSRATMLPTRFDGSWKIVPEHFSSVPDWIEVAGQGSNEGETL